MPTTDADRRVWLDPERPAAEWPAPVAAPGRSVSPGVVLLVVVVALALVVALVWGLGGFRRRTDVLVDTAVGTTITTGPYELRFTEVTAQQRTDYKDEVSWRVSVVGEGRTTGDEALAPDFSGDDGMFVAKDRASGEYHTADNQLVGAEAEIGGVFTPGLPSKPFTVVFEFSRDYRPGPDLLFVVYQLELRDSSLLGNQEEQWRNANRAHRFTMPVRVLPPATS